ncbi:MAG: hypothetical protein DF168_00346 [Candidatus Moanabacter tarae]|uniref:Uncharacterized protein n=1 Tax=Candidatus Moanibacter tarae TaxID=2200854 RepID=A0A2Z4AE34_9BACT|nr:MAG: hypothetical protein DF168_00346 [Candidatus Moanabacter tarae]
MQRTVSIGGMFGENSKIDFSHPNLGRKFAKKTDKFCFNMIFSLRDRDGVVGMGFFRLWSGFGSHWFKILGIGFEP